MKSKITSLLIAIVTFGFLGISFALPARADDPNDICSNTHVSEEIKAASGCEGYNGGDLKNTIINIINVVLGIIAIIALIAIIIGGVQYMTSTGDPGKVKKAKDTIMYSVIGLIIVSLAAVIVNFVINATNNSITPTTPAASSYTKEADCTAASYKWNKKAKECTE